MTRGVDERGALPDGVTHPDSIEETVLGLISRAFTALPSASFGRGDAQDYGHSPPEADGWSAPDARSGGLTSRCLLRAVEAGPQRSCTSVLSCTTATSDESIQDREMVGLVGISDVGACTYPDLVHSSRMTTCPGFPISVASVSRPPDAKPIDRMWPAGSMVKIRPPLLMNLLVVLARETSRRESLRASQLSRGESPGRSTTCTSCVCSSRGLMDDLLTGRVRVSVDEDAA